MTTTLTIDELEQSGERDLGTSSWHDITQEQVNQFADATGDHQWIHVDPERAAQTPWGSTIAHGYLTLSLVVPLVGQLIEAQQRSMGVNYGLNKVRFPAPVPVGSRVRLNAKLARTMRRGPSIIWTVAVQVEIEGKEKPALVGEVVYMAAGMPDA